MIWYSNTLFWHSKIIDFKLNLKLHPQILTLWHKWYLQARFSQTILHMPQFLNQNIQNSARVLCKCASAFTYKHSSLVHMPEHMPTSRDTSRCWSHTSLRWVQARGQVCCFLLLCKPLKFCVSCADALVCISLFKYKCFHTFSSDKIGCAALLETDCYLPVPLCKLKTHPVILADDIISLALGKQLENENGLKQKCLIELFPKTVGKEYSWCR